MVFYQLSYLILWVPSLKGRKHFLPYTWKRHHAYFAYQMSVVSILTCIQYIYTKRDHLPENILQKHGFSRLMYLMTFRHRCIWPYMNLTHE